MGIAGNLRLTLGKLKDDDHHYSNFFLIFIYFIQTFVNYILIKPNYLKCHLFYFNFLFFILKKNIFIKISRSLCTIKSNYTLLKYYYFFFFSFFTLKIFFNKQIFLN